MSTILPLFYFVNALSFITLNRGATWSSVHSNQQTALQTLSLIIKYYKLPEKRFQQILIIFYYSNDLKILWFGTWDAGTLTDKQYIVIIRCICALFSYLYAR